jgi:hypothetical protein
MAATYGSFVSPAMRICDASLLGDNALNDHQLSSRRMSVTKQFGQHCNPSLIPWTLPSSASFQRIYRFRDELSGSIASALAFKVPSDARMPHARQVYCRWRLLFRIDPLGI